MSGETEENVKFFGQQHEEPEIPSPSDDEENRSSESGGERAYPPSFRPPAIVTETRIPNIFQDITEALGGTSSLEERQYFSTVIVVQGDDPDEVAAKIKALRSHLEVTDGSA